MEMGDVGMSTWVWVLMWLFAGFIPSIILLFKDWWDGIDIYIEDAWLTAILTVLGPIGLILIIGITLHNNKWAVIFKGRKG